MDIRKRKGFTLIELLVVVAIIALLISILLPSLARARELAKRAVSRANMRGIGQSCYIYANDNRERFPVANYELKATTDRYVPGNDYLVQMGKETAITDPFTDTNDTAQRQELSVSRAMFLLIIAGANSPKQYINPSASDTVDDLRNDEGTNEYAANPGQDRFDFKGYNRFSYGYQHPYNRVAPPDTDMDVRMALGADKGPWVDSGSNDGWAGSTATTGLDASSTANRPMNGINTLDDILAQSNEQWRPYNSRNHNGEGQSILFIDGHVDFEQKPIVGPNQDNIYTRVDADDPSDLTDDDAIIDYMKGRGIEVASNGTITTSKAEGPLTSTDSFIVP
jgi:prepilin-type N-terminal cleavage/methylation domain-containing protein